MLASLFGDDDPVEVSAPDTIGGKVTLQRPPEERSSTKFMGLENQGATCYLNALLQSVYMTPELRFGLFTLDPMELGAEYIEEFEKGKKNNEIAGIIEADEGLLSQMTGMGFSEFISRKALIVTKNAGVDHAMDWCYNNPNEQEPSSSELAEEKKKKKKKPRLIPLELQSLFTKMMFLNRLAISTEDLTTKGFQWQGHDGRVQHDAHELNRLLIDALEKSLKHTTGVSLCKDIYQGKLSYQTTCLTCNRVSTRSEPYYDLNVQIIGCDDLTKSFRTYCASEVLEGDSAYHCDNCQCKVTAHRRTVINKLPPVLTISLNRFRIDKSTNWQRQKVTSSSSFPLILDFYPYMGEQAPVSAPLPVIIPEQTSASSTEATPSDETKLLDALKSHAIWIEEVSAAALEVANVIISKYLEENSQLQTPPDLSSLSHQNRLFIDDRIIGKYESNIHQHKSSNHHNVNNRYQEVEYIDNNSNNRHGSMTYQLSTVILHRGSAHSGHYFAYIRDQLDEGHWDMPLSSYDEPTSSAKSSSDDKIPVQHYTTSTDAAGVTTFHVNPASPLSTVMAIFQECGSPYIIESKANHDMNVTTVCVAKDKIQREVTRIVGTAWSYCYRPTYGTIPEFLKSVKDILASDETGNIIYMMPNAYTNTFLAPDNTSSANQVQPTTLFNEHETPSMNSDDLSHDDHDNSDEQIAKALQEEENGKISTRSSNRSSRQQTSSSSMEIDNDPSSWQTASSQRKRNKNVKATTTAKNNGTTNHKSTSNDDNLDDHKKKDADIIVKHRRSLEHSFADMILGYYFGKFFEFNDSRVNAMSIKQLMKSFQGKDSAYLLVYRQMSSSLPKLTDISSSSSSSASSSVQPPSYWYEKVSAMNQELAQQRELYDKNAQNIKVTIKFPVHVRYEHPIVHLAILNHLEHNLPEELMNGMEISVHEKMKISELSTMLVKTLVSYHQALGITSPSTSSSTSSKDLVFSILRSLPSLSSSSSNGSFSSLAMNDDKHVYQLRHTLTPTTTIYDLQHDTKKAGRYLLLWNGDMLPSMTGAMVPASLTKAPLLSYSISSLTLSSTSLDMTNDTIVSSIPDMMITSEGIRPTIHRNITRIFYYSSDASLEETCVCICDTLGISPATAIIHAIVDGQYSSSSSSSILKTPRNKTQVIDLSMDISDNETTSDDKGNKRLRKGQYDDRKSDHSITGEAVKIWSQGKVVYKASSEPVVASNTPAVSLSGRPIRNVRNNTPSSNSTSSSITKLQDISHLLEIVVEEASLSSSLHNHVHYATREQVQKQLITLTINIIYPGHTNGISSDVWIVLVDKHITIETLQHHALQHFNIMSTSDQHYYFIDYDNSSIDNNAPVIKHAYVNMKQTVSDCKWQQVDDNMKHISLVAFSAHNANHLISSYSISHPIPTSSDTIILNIHCDTSIQPLHQIQVSIQQNIIDTKDQILQHFFPDTFHTFTPLSSSSLHIDPYYHHNPSSDAIEHGAGSGKYHAAYRLHHATWNGDVGGIIDEYDTEAEISCTWGTFFKDHETVYASSTERIYEIYMVPGYLPMKGRKHLPIYLWLDAPIDHHQCFFNQPCHQANQPMDIDAEQEDVVIINTSSVTAAVQNDNEAEDEPVLSVDDTQYLMHVNDMKQQHLYPLGVITIHESDLIMDLYTSIHSHIQSQLPILQKFAYDTSYIMSSIEASIHKLLVRGITPSYLPGKCYWHVEPKAAASTSTTMARIGVRSTEVKGDMKSLKKVGLINAKEKMLGLVVECLPETQAILCPPATAVHLWYHQLADDHDGQYMQFKPSYPPSRFLLNHGLTPSLGHLKRRLSEVSGIAFESIGIAKFYPATAQWREFQPGMKAIASKSTTSSTGNGHITSTKKVIISSKKKGEENLFDPPYSIREGDIFCVYDQQKHVFTSSEEIQGNGSNISAVRLSRREDVLQQRLMAAAALKKKKGNVVNRRKSDRKTAVTPRREVLLSLGGNLDFSDDEDDDYMMG